MQPDARGTGRLGYLLAVIQGLRITIDDSITTRGYVKCYVRRRIGGRPLMVGLIATRPAGSRFLARAAGKAVRVQAADPDRRRGDIKLRAKYRREAGGRRDPSTVLTEWLLRAPLPTQRKVLRNSYPQ